ncbi:MAG: DNA-3-methyladenine glycosylase I [Candidatus Iainarchaeum archaeon]|uniref:DNA-3-methyladenine glycosylase I n=1 Tax=Candidatus Iainarchaeum sp. TaxID=3101447 RepID=A0A7T9DJF6_9ARCH|nr:MAG: DNA-3-methyladenine glycosylase I [Candidatus Diapherotrites archaeon]
MNNGSEKQEVNRTRCPWPGANPLMVAYHDEEWGVPLHDDRKLFEFMILDAFQAGLSWNTIINKRKNFEMAFSGFDVKKISRYTEKDFDRLMQDSGIIRNRLKIRAAIQNAKCFLQVQKEFGSFDRYIWQFVHHQPIQNKIRTLKDYQAKTKESDAMSKDLLKRGFKFVGSTICYAFMQAAGMVNDHAMDCFRYKEVAKMK